MPALDSIEYGELVRQAQVWEAFCETFDQGGTSRDEQVQAQLSLLSERDAAYETYANEHGHPEGHKLLALPPEELNVLITTGGHYLIAGYLREFGKYGVSLVDRDAMAYSLPPGTTEETAAALRQAAPYWKSVTADEIWADD